MYTDSINVWMILFARLVVKGQGHFGLFATGGISVSQTHNYLEKNLFLVLSRKELTVCRNVVVGGTKMC